MNENSEPSWTLAFLHSVAIYVFLSELTLVELAAYSATASASDDLIDLYQIIVLSDRVQDPKEEFMQYVHTGNPVANLQEPTAATALPHIALHFSLPTKTNQSYNTSNLQQCPQPAATSVCNKWTFLHSTQPKVKLKT
ncbi:hypothetical protein KIW84_023491 [Lathyrus oleraceus]|uniref:Uncharacterized protein n=1 Tax=Pisum sativum TaxID=3888 RepID=A0A9D4YD37_PEA|nr:hypothetical protein KIW84_023491 [Pisum sativum]